MAEAKNLVGKKAPAFTLRNQSNEKRGLKDYAGKWLVLYFYPKDDTPGCTVEACDFTSLLAQFRALDAVVVGVSPDNADRHTKFIAKYELGVELLSDPDHQAMAKYGAWGMKKNYGREYEGVIRSTLIVGPDGKVVHHWPNVKAKGHAERVKEKLAELRAS